MDPIAKFDNPPVIETVLGVQFAPLERFTTSHVGLFWSNYLDEAWRDVKEATPLAHHPVMFGPKHKFRRQVLKIEQANPSPRTQVVHKNQEQMLQIQEDRFIFNWRRRGRDYPSYDSLRPEFWKHFGVFESFVQTSDLGDIKPNLWEVTYVNQVRKGDLWNSINDWGRIFPNILAPYDELKGQSFEGISSNWAMELGQEQGRLVVSFSHVLVESENVPKEEPTEAIDFRLSAQGPIRSMDELDQSFDLGHEAIVSRFVQMTSDDAQRHWGRTV